MSGHRHIQDAIAAFAAGEVLIVVDSEERENEGDFVVAAERVTPQTVDFMLRVGRGQLCVPILPDRAARLELEPMVLELDESAPRFTIPVDHAGSKTGISPRERCATIRSLLDPDTRPTDLLRPGHVFPLVARPEGVLRRPGHTEAAVDLARLADLAPAAVLCEICSDRGFDMADRDELLEIAWRHGLLVVTIEELIAHRRADQGTPHQLAKPAVSSCDRSLYADSPR